MDYQAELYLNPYFNYLRFYKEGKLTDCELVFPEENEIAPIKAHAIILANSSDFFLNAFTGNLGEAKSGKVQMTDNPMNLLPKVIEFLYSGKLEYTEGEVMSLLHIANAYFIQSLQHRMHCHLNSTLNHQNIYEFANQCYQYELEAELVDKKEGLVPYFVKFFDKLNIENLTQTLDVITFCYILEGLNKPYEETFRILDQFIGPEWKCDKEEKEACGKLFNTGDPKVRNFLAKKKPTWLPDGYLK
ncbi:hypothetical protein M9Y10_009207 [Tritrichomonas musculus]|uniref:BTB domain-containing protein n=1 Tax=Tritrichomonas musculus TaxID=1915356 RepID=A0ABR2IMN5_9EUKA